MTKLSLFSLILTNTCMLAKSCCFTDDETCPTSDTFQPTFSCWWIRQIIGRFNLSHKRPRLSNTFMLVKQAVFTDDYVIPDFSQIGQYSHKWYFTPCSSLWWFHQIHSFKPESTFTPIFMLCNNLCYTTHVVLGKFADLPDSWKRPTNDPN